MVAHDVDRLVSSFAKASWDKFIHVTASAPSSSSELYIGSDSFSRIWGFLQRTLLDPGGVYLNINPPQPAAPSPLPRKPGSRAPPVTRKDSEPIRAKGDEDEENELDRKARLRIGAFGAAEWVLSGCILSINGLSGGDISSIYLAICRYANTFITRIESSRINNCSS